MSTCFCKKEAWGHPALDHIKGQHADGTSLCNPYKEIQTLSENRNKLLKALWYAHVRLEILTGRMRACHEETGKHELLDEAQMFVDEAKSDLAGWEWVVGEQKK